MLGVVLGGHWLPPCQAGNVLSPAWSRLQGKVTPAAAAQKPFVPAGTRVIRLTVRGLVRGERADQSRKLT